MLSQSAKYYIPNPSYWPVIGSIALFCMALGAALWFNGTGDGGADGGKWLVLAGALILTYSSTIVIVNSTRLPLTASA